MGRRPHPLVLEFFERGPKLADSSNRYQHTCKSCGEVFPKGRLDSLMSHITKKCHAIPLEDRKRAVAKLFDLPRETLEGAPGEKNGNIVTASGKRVNLPYARGKTINGLEALAEASRQLTEKTSPSTDAEKKACSSGGKEIVIDPALESQDALAHGRTPSTSKEASHEQTSSTFVPSSTEPNAFLQAGPSTVLEGIATSTGPNLNYAVTTPISTSPVSSPDFRSALQASLAPYAQQPTNLSRIAASANEMEASMTSTANMQNDRDWALNGARDFQTLPNDRLPTQILSPLRIGDFNGPYFTSLLSQQGAPRPDQMWPMNSSLADIPYTNIRFNAQQAAAFPRPIAINPNGLTRGFEDFSMRQQPPRHKVRGRFTPTRRKEVQEVRKMGACLRCRMLKKPCSGDDPCATCQNVESARLWRTPCIRARLVEELELFSAGLYTTLAYHGINSARAQHEFEHHSGRIEVTCWDGSEYYMTFSPLQAHKSIKAVTFDPSLPIEMEQESTFKPIWILDDSVSVDLGDKLDLYLKKIAPAFQEAETSNFMQCTLKTAESLNRVQKDNLLNRTLFLWTATNILVSKDLVWRIFYNKNAAPSTSPIAGPIIPSDEHMPFDFTDDQGTYALIRAQLLAVVEKRCAVLSKSILNDIEKRLLQRQQTALAFTTVLASVILLNCVERSTWLFKNWDDAELAQKWPLDRTPMHYVSQCNRFTEILTMLLKIRSLQPRTAVSSATDLLKAADGSDLRTREWIASWCLRSSELSQRVDAVHDPNDLRSYDLKYTAKLLLPPSLP